MPLAAKRAQWGVRIQCKVCAKPFLTYAVSLLISHVLSQIQTGLNAFFLI